MLPTPDRDDDDDNNNNNNNNNNGLAHLPRMHTHTTKFGHSRNLSYSAIIAREIDISLAAPQPPPRLRSQTAAAPPSKPLLSPFLPKATTPTPQTRPIPRPSLPPSLSPSYSTIIATEIALSLCATPPIYFYPALHQQTSPGAIGYYAPLLRGGERVYPLVPTWRTMERMWDGEGEGEGDEEVIFHSDTGTFEVLRHGHHHTQQEHHHSATTDEPSARVTERERNLDVNINGSETLRAAKAQQQQQQQGQKHTNAPPSPSPSPRKHQRRVSRLIEWGREVSSRKERRRRRSVV
ncbi:hypothetical protein IWX90DRAFT_418041 [Phyllosticta citrichinensis]|uniref:Uncharacterized protein n=1 Tax=Phyllosticta citrichinensis TaxID=1130410 RepID=A0ABR1XK09_9PEZI